MPPSTLGGIQGYSTGTFTGESYTFSNDMRGILYITNSGTYSGALYYIDGYTATKLAGTENITVSVNQTTHTATINVGPYSSSPTKWKFY